MPGSLDYDLALDYGPDPQGRRALPRLQLAVEFFPAQPQLRSVSAVVDSGADASAFDGTLAIQAGWTWSHITDRALLATSIRGISAGRPIPAYLHQVTCTIGGYSLFAEIPLRVFITPPNSLAYSILGRSDFFEQVDVTFVELEKKLFLRFRNRAVLRGAEAG
jgi:hypothetical protein